MIQSPITKVLSSMRANGVACLLMGGQACIFYGAAEFSRDIDFALHVQPDNLERLQQALADLKATRIAVPPFEPEYLMRGHAVHFRCEIPEAARLRIDVMGKLRGVAPFPELWDRRTTIHVDGLEIDLLSLPDLVAAKRTQREKDWLMTNRLIEADYYGKQDPGIEDIRFWLKESFDPELLSTICQEYSQWSEEAAFTRKAVAALLEDDVVAAESLLLLEKQSIIAADKEYWKPLKQELEQLRKT